MYNIKNLSKRGLALFLTLVMCLGMLNLTAFAEDTGVTFHPVEIASQDVDGVTVDGPDGTFINGKKTIQPVNGKDDQFDITLEVTTKSKSTTTVVNQAADVVLVLDVTDSMDDNGRWGKMKAAVNSFVEKLLPAGNTTNRVSIMIYAGDYYQLCDWATNASVVKDTYKGYENSDTLRGKISDGKKQDYQGTNCSAGFLGADVQLDSARSDALQYVVFMTDGAANTYYNDALKQEKTLTCNKQESFWHKHSDRCYSYSYKVQAVSSNSGSVTWEGNNTDKYSSDAAIAQTTQLKSNHAKATLIAVGFGTSTDNKVVSKSTNTSLDQSYTTGTVDFDEILKDISDSITEDVNAAGTVVTDPMSSYVTFQEVTSGQGGTFNEGANILSWDLSKVKPTTTKDGDYTISTYRLTYRVTVNRTADFYEAVKNSGVDEDGNVVGVPTNRPTFMPYTLGDQSGTLNFIIPHVKSEMPEAPWRIEYYKQENADVGKFEDYTLVSKDTKTGRGEFGTTVDLAEQDSNYQNKYNGANYVLAKADGAITIGLDPEENVIRVYYNRVTTSATVNYHYTLTTIDENGNVSEPVTYDISGTPVTGLYVGDSYSVNPPQTSEHGGIKYTYQKAEPSATISFLKTDSTENVIDLYYTATVDNRAEAHVVVDHVYRTHTYVMEDGKYVEKIDSVTVEKVEEATRKATTEYTATNAPAPGEKYAQYKPDPANESAKTITLQPGENKIILYFDYTDDQRGDPIEVTVVHHYTKQVTAADENGEVKTTTTTGEVSEAAVTKYVGEKFEAVEQIIYDNEEYTSDADNAAKKVIDSLTGSVTIELHYSLVRHVDSTFVTVNHIYQTVTHETQEIYKDVTRQEIVRYEPGVDDDGNEIQIPIYEDVTEKVLTGTQVVDVIVTDEELGKTIIVEGLYGGQKYIAGTIGVQDYECQTSEEKRTAWVDKDGKTVIDVYYLRDKGNVDNRDAADIDVQHVYTSHVTTVLGGQVIEYDTFVTVPGEKYEGKVGDEYEAKPITEYGGVEYEVVDESELELTRILHAGTNSTIVIPYERYDNQLKDAAYEVHYEYYTRSMTIEDGVAVWGEPVMDVEMSASKAPVYVNEGVYVGQKVELDTGAVDGYAPYGSNPAATQFLKEEGNVYTFQYVKDVPLPRVAVTVNHHYTTRTLTLDGEFSDTQDMPGRPVYWYVGESCEANALPVDGLVRVTVDGVDTATEAVVALQDLTADVVVDFYYEVVNDLRNPASYTVQHIYHTYDWDGSEIESEMVESEPQKTKTYVFMKGSASVSLPDNAGYELTEATFNGASVDVDASGTYSFTVLETENEIVFVYERHIDTRPLTSAQVIHEYYASQDALENGELEGSDLVNIPDLRVGETIQAELRTSNGGRTYAMANASALSITVVENKEQNVITIQYIRATTTYQVIHEYYTNGELTGSTSSTLAGNAGDTITAESIAKETTYGGNTYTYTRASGDPLTLVQGENGAIILRYDRSTGGGTPTPTPTPDDDDDDDDPPAPPTPEDETTPEEEVPEEEVPLVDTPEEEIPDEEIPMIQEPKTPEEEEEEILDEDVPLSVVPQTGDGSGLWFNMGLVSALGLALLRFFRKREE